MSTVEHTADKPEVEDLSPLQGQRGRKVNAFIGKGVEFNGNLSYDGTIRVDGVFEGEIHTEGCLLIGEGATVTAKVRAGTVICKGKIRGDIIAREKVILREPAVLTGSLTTPILSVEEGVRFNGELTMSQNLDAGMLEPETEITDFDSEPSLTRFA